ncbi:MAG: hypothetical protein J7539_07660 [Niabella sp.]|nr:hypothetical protein [Niabella sp.]
MRYCCLLMLLFICGNVFSQSSLREKLYLHTDKNDYVLGDTIWFKTYLVDAFTLLPVIRSGIEYVELIDENKKAVQRIALHSFAGTGFGDIAIDTAFAPGNYILRAYTNWMQNFGDSLFFQKQLTIGGARTDDWLVTSAPPVVKESDKGYDISVVYQFKEKNLEPLHNRPVSFFITDEAGRTMQAGKLQTDYQGKLEATFTLTKQQAGSPVFARIGSSKKDIKKIIPLFSGKNIDLQLLPESGHLVAGLPNTVGFKAIAEDGLGYDIKGVIKDNTGGEIISFQSLYKGMGSFNFIPEAGKTYTAFLQNGQQVALPKPEPEGILLHVSQNYIDTAIRLQIQATTAFANKEYILQADAKGATVYKEKIVVKSEAVVLRFPKSTFPTGVARFILQNDKGQLLSERAIFVNNNSHRLNIQLQTPLQSYHPRDSIPVNITVKDKEGKPVLGSFSFAVTDDSQVKKDSKADQNILSYLLLQSDLKGTIETPGYYFSSAGAPPSGDRGAALDALMLTQGFVRYDWDTATFKYEAEPEFVVKGKVNNMLNKSAKNAKLTLLGNGPKVHFLRDTTCNTSGEFTFTDLPAFDTITLIALSRSKIGSRFGLDIKLQQAALPNTSNLALPYHYNRVGMDTALLNTLQNSQTYDQAFLKKNGFLPNVIVKGKTRIQGAFDYGELMQTVGPDEIKPGINKNLLDLLTEKVKGFGIRALNLKRALETNFVIGNRPAMIYIDGLYMDRGLFVREDKQQLLENRLSFLRAYNGYDIKSIEVFNPRTSYRKYGEFERALSEDRKVPDHNAPEDNKAQNSLQGILGELSRVKQALPGDSRMDRILQNISQGMVLDILDIEVTTYSGTGPFKKTTPGQSYLYPQPFSYGKTFYAPRYNANYINDSLPDYRSTIYWNPLVVTNANGEANVSFYAADLPSSNSGKPVTYTLWIEGMDLEGNVGVKTEKIEVK